MASLCSLQYGQGYLPGADSFVEKPQTVPRDGVHSCAQQLRLKIGGSTDLVNCGSFTLALHHARGNETTTARLPIGQHGGAVLHDRRAETAALRALSVTFTCVGDHFVDDGFSV